MPDNEKDKRRDNRTEYRPQMVVDGDIPETLVESGGSVPQNGTQKTEAPTMPTSPIESAKEQRRNNRTEYRPQTANTAITEEGDKGSVPQNGTPTTTPPQPQAATSAAAPVAKPTEPATPAAATSTTVPQNGTVEENPYAKAKEFYDQLITDYEKKIAKHPETERREKWRDFISGIGDASRAIANLYYTNQYAPNAYEQDKGLSAANRRRMERAKAEREKEKGEYYNFLKERSRIGEQERKWQLEKERYDRYKQHLEEEAERKRKAEEKSRINSEATSAENAWKLMTAQGKFNYTAEMARLDTELRQKKITPDEYKAKKAALDKVESTRITNETKEARSAARRSSSGSGRKNEDKVVETIYENDPITGNTTHKKETVTYGKQPKRKSKTTL